jgi:hypothetical protein
LIHPPIDEERLMKIRAKQKMIEQQNKSGPKKKISLSD